MPRKPRYRLPGVPQHVIQRGNNRQACFFCEQDYHCYLDALATALNKYGARLHAYVLMTNHVHLLLTPDEPDTIPSVMQSVGRRYVRYVNREYGRSGTLWEGRYKASLIDTEHYLFVCQRYIELNPVRAGMVAQPGDYAWSSYRTNAEGNDNEILSAHPEYKRLGTTDQERRANYRELFAGRLHAEAITEIRNALNHESVAGTSRFKDEIEAFTKRCVRIRKPGRPRSERAEGGN